jgi:hypothetical protein
MDIDYVNLPYWDLCAALRLARLISDDLAKWTAFFIPFGRHDITEHIFRESGVYSVRFRMKQGNRVVASASVNVQVRDGHDDLGR